eukprot:9419664-Pyramimonas_sp.AAC.1
MTAVRPSGPPTMAQAVTVAVAPSADDDDNDDDDDDDHAPPAAETPANPPEERKPDDAASEDAMTEVALDASMVAAGGAGDADLLPEFVGVPREDDGAVEGARLKAAIVDANNSLGQARRAAKWASMVRKMNTKGCPPLIKEKWDACGSCKQSKNEVFGLFLACGGEVGQMNCIEQMIRTEVRRFEDCQGWFTTDDLLKLCHGKQDKVDNLKKKASADPKRVRPHPDHPDDAEMTQYQAFESSK